MKKWKNTIKRYIALPSKIVRVKRLQDVVTAVLEAERKKIPIRAVGSGHSFSDVAIVPKGGIMLDFTKVDHFSIQNKNTIHTAFHQKNLVKVGGGLTVKNFNKHLDNHNLAIVNMGGIDHQTLSGAVATGTHGTGINLPAMTGMVRSILLVAAGGRVHRIEPTEGITNPHYYNERGIELIQNDDAFNSVLVSMGCMGIIYSMILEVNNMYWLKEEKSLHNWEKIHPLILNKKIHSEKDLRSVMIQVNPYKVKGQRSCLVIKHFNTTKACKRTFNQATRNWLPFLANNYIVYSYIMWRINRKPQNAPKRIEGVLNGQKDKIYVNRGHKVLYQGVEFIKERAYDSEFAFNLNETSYLIALDKIFKAADNFKGINIYQTSPIGLRFVKKSNAYLTPEYQRDVCYVDTPFLLKTRGSDIILDTYQEIMLKHGGIPHWGKINSILDKQPEILAEIYPKLNIWMDHLQQFNPHGIFSNSFSKRLLLQNSGSKTVKI